MPTEGERHNLASFNLRASRRSLTGKGRSEDGSSILRASSGGLASFASRKGAKSSKVEDKDPDQLIHEFDDKLAEINAMLNRIKEDNSKGSGGKSGKSSARDMSLGKGKERAVTEEEAYKNSKIQRRVKSAGPGCSRALTERIELYRSSPLARAELSARVKNHIKLREEQGVANAAAARASGGVDFVRANKMSLRKDPEELMAVLMSTAGSSSLGTAPSGVTGLGEDAWAGGDGMMRPGTAFEAADRSRPAGRWDHLGAGRPMTSGSMRSMTHSYDYTAVRLPSSNIHDFHSYFRPSSDLNGRPPVSATSTMDFHGYFKPSSPMDHNTPFVKGSPSTSYDFHSYFKPSAAELVPQNSGGLAGGRTASSPHSVAFKEEVVTPHAFTPGRHITIAESMGSSDTGGSPAPSRAMSAGLSRTGPSRMASSRHPLSAMSMRSHASFTGTLNPEVAAAERELRITLTSRPATGGSPTRREAFIAERKYLSIRRDERLQAARQRRDQADAEADERRHWLADKRDKLAEAEAKRREEEMAVMETLEKRRVWLGIVNLSHKIWFVAEAVKEHRLGRPWRELRKWAAVRIATWYKEILMRRRQRALVMLIRRVRNAMRPHLHAKKVMIRRNCADRIIHFLQVTEHNHASIAVNAVKKFLESVRNLQHHWRLMLEVRKMQRMILYNYFLRFERSLVSKNAKEKQKRDHAAAIMAKMSRHRRSSAGPGALPPQPPRDRSSSPELRTSLSRNGQHTTFGGGKRAIEIEDRELDNELSMHVELLPRELRLKIVDEAVVAERRTFYKRLDQYRADMQVYLAQKPIEDLRIKLLVDAGLEAHEQLRRPQKPAMHVLLPRPKLKVMLQQAIRIHHADRIKAEIARREELEAAAAMMAATRDLGRESRGIPRRGSPSPRSGSPPPSPKGKKPKEPKDPGRPSPPGSPKAGRRAGGGGGSLASAPDSPKSRASSPSGRLRKLKL